MDKDDNSCKQAWKSLRDSYKYHKCKQPKSGSAGGDLLEKPTGATEWDFAHYMSFLPDLSTQRQTTHSVFSESDGAQAMDYSIEETQDPVEAGFLEAEAELEVELSEAQKELYSYGGGRRSAKKRKVEETPAAKMCDMLGNFLEQQQKATLPTPPRPVFAYWESILSTLPPERAAEVERKMTRLLWEEKDAS
ncbi:uncharacterized protein LOC123037475 [Drosophila rhopaloa]|uniref:MADF domain-containing protein n=1 Tax=Drosophila rhopaloa TaxID=1041015 RepID=A0ABM5J650_DRORH|nr:uncharacterized protein LOC123037475 [Drosophila rhopaloa]